MDVVYVELSDSYDAPKYWERLMKAFGDVAQCGVGVAADPEARWFELHLRAASPGAVRGTLDQAGLGRYVRDVRLLDAPGRGLGMARQLGLF